MEQMIIENNNPNQLGIFIMLIVGVFVITNIVRIIFDIRRKNRLEAMLEKLKERGEEK